MTRLTRDLGYVRTRTYVYNVICLYVHTHAKAHLLLLVARYRYFAPVLVSESYSLIAFHVSFEKM